LSASGSSEAKPLITEHREAVLPIAEALMVHHTLDAEQIDTIIAAAPERARRIDWNGGAARIVAHDVERVFADIDADHGDRGIGCLRHGVLLVFGAPLPASLAGGQEHGRTIPLPDVDPSKLSSTTGTMLPAIACRGNKGQGSNEEDSHETTRCPCR
jgi:hypothetical protein